MSYGSSPDQHESVSGLYLDDKYYLHYPPGTHQRCHYFAICNYHVFFVPGMKMTDGIPADVMEVVNSHVSNDVIASYHFVTTKLPKLHCSTAIFCLLNICCSSTLGK